MSYLPNYPAGRPRPLNYDAWSAHEFSTMDSPTDVENSYGGDCSVPGSKRKRTLSPSTLVNRGTESFERHRPEPKPDARGLPMSHLPGHVRLESWPAYQRPSWDKTNEDYGIFVNGSPMSYSYMSGSSKTPDNLSSSTGSSYPTTPPGMFASSTAPQYNTMPSSMTMAFGDSPYAQVFTGGSTLANIAAIDMSHPYFKVDPIPCAEPDCSEQEVVPCGLQPGVVPCTGDNCRQEDYLECHNPKCVQDMPLLGVYDYGHGQPQQDLLSFNSGQGYTYPINSGPFGFQFNNQTAQMAQQSLVPLHQTCFLGQSPPCTDPKCVDPRAINCHEDHGMRTFQPLDHSLGTFGSAKENNELNAREPTPANQMHRCMWAARHDHLCGMCFPSESELQDHLRECHAAGPGNQQKVYVCLWSGCDREFKGRTKLTRHFHTHSGHKGFKCNWKDPVTGLGCDKKMATEDAIKKHMLTHTGEKPHVCSFCSKPFATTSERKTHEQTHTGKKPHVCGICMMPFSDSSNLSKHAKTHLVARFHCEEPGCMASMKRWDQISRHCYQLQHMPQLVMTKEMKRNPMAPESKATLANIQEYKMRMGKLWNAIPLGQRSIRLTERGLEERERHRRDLGRRHEELTEEKYLALERAYGADDDDFDGDDYSHTADDGPYEY